MIGREVIELLAENETKVGRLYETIAESSRMEIGAEFFLNLAKDEFIHHDYYKGMLKDQKLLDSLNTPLTEEEEDYLRSLMDSNVMKYEQDLIEKAKIIWKEEDAFIIADKIERETILLVNEIIRLFPEFSPETMEKILHEEKIHLMKVAKAYDQYKQKYNI
ncbi:MAG: hypothetical protein Q4G11_03890 [Gallicola sp.]|nr:hypothetical protein [Gallicola sp.]